MEPETAQKQVRTDLRDSLRQVAPHLTDDQVDALVSLADLYVERLLEVRRDYPRPKATPGYGPIR